MSYFLVLLLAAIPTLATSRPATSASETEQFGDVPPRVFPNPFALKGNRQVVYMYGNLNEPSLIPSENSPYHQNGHQQNWSKAQDAPAGLTGQRYQYKIVPQDDVQPYEKYNAKRVKPLMQRSSRHQSDYYDLNAAPESDTSFAVRSGVSSFKTRSRLMLNYNFEWDNSEPSLIPSENKPYHQH